MKFLDRLLPWRSPSKSADDDKTVQYEIHRRTHRGGWKNPYEDVYIGEPQPRPEDDDDWWLLGPGEYRHIRRVDGRIDEVYWMYETADAEEFYAEKREQERREAERKEQRRALHEMTFEEVRAEYFGDTNRLDLLDFDEIADRYERLEQARKQATQEEALTEEEQEKLRRAKALKEAIERRRRDGPNLFE